MILCATQEHTHHHIVVRRAVPNANEVDFGPHGCFHKQGSLNKGFTKTYPKYFSWNWPANLADMQLICIRINMLYYTIPVLRDFN